MKFSIHQVILIRLAPEEAIRRPGVKQPVHED